MKKTLAIVGLGTAFLAVSLWVWLSNGKSAKAVKAKFRLGGALLTLTGMMSLGSCTPPGGTCYDPACYDPAPANEIWWTNADYRNEEGVFEVRNGDQLTIHAQYLTVNKLVVALNDAAAMEMQREVFEVDYNTKEVLFTVDVDDYVGEAELIVSLVGDGDEVTVFACELNVVE